VRRKVVWVPIATVVALVVVFVILAAAGLVVPLLGGTGVSM
jgi:small neutral amino acid transporter SnatA (MarC family)